MSSINYFPLYLEIINDGLKRIKKGGLKKYNLIKDFIDFLQDFLNKEVYGRVQPSNYLLFFLLMLGTRNPKIINNSILTIQRLLSNNFIQLGDDLSSSIRLLKDDYKQFMIFSKDDYSNKPFKELYILSLLSLNERDDALNLLISKNISLIWRLGLNTLSGELICKMYDFLIQTIIQNKSDDTDKILKSTFLQIIRHAFQSYRQSQDAKLIQEDQQMSIKTACFRYGKILVDQVAIRLSLNDQNYQVIPNNPNNAQLKNISDINQKGNKSGKFGWCIICRQPANYYCRNYKVPVCSYQCKQNYFKQTGQFDKLLTEQTKSNLVFRKHTNQLVSLFTNDLSHPDIRRRVVFAQNFVFVCSQLKKFQSEMKTNRVNTGLHNIFKQCIYNVMIQSQAFFPCLVCTKKMIFFRIFVDDLQVFLYSISKKITYFLTNSKNRQDLLKVIKQLVSSQIILDIFMSMDCIINRKDSIKVLIQSVAQVYLGISIPQNLTIIDEPQNRKLAIQTISNFISNIINCHKMISNQKNQIVKIVKKQKNIIRNAIQQFNNTQKPLKIIKKLIKQGKISKQPSKIAQFMHEHLKRLDLVNVGVLIGDIDEFAVQIRDQYIGRIDFKNLMVDQAIRVLLQYFTLGGQSQVVQRIIDCFSKAYYYANQPNDTYYHSDAVYSFSYLLMMLQTNLHNPQVIQKMTVKQFSDLSKGMNGPTDFRLDFLQATYQSIQKTQLGFHNRMKQIQILTAYKQNPKKALQIHIKQLQKQSKKILLQLKPNPKNLLPDQYRYSLDIIIQQCGCKIIDVHLQRIRQIDEKQKDKQRQQIKKIFKQIQNILGFSTKYQISLLIQHAIKYLWQDIIKISTLKKFTLIQQFLDWVNKYNQYIYSQWSVVLSLFSKFNKNKLIKKDPTNKNLVLTIINDKCYIIQHFIEGLIAKSIKFTQRNLLNMIQGYIQVSKSQISQNQKQSRTYSLQKINQVIQFNSSRLNQIFPQIWPILKQYYFQLGKHRIKQIALSGTDFLKQLVTKFVKKKDLINYQKQYLKPLQDIFNISKIFDVKQYIVGSISYFINNHFQVIKIGWKTFLSILANCFQEDQQIQIKQKALGVIKKIFQSNFSIIDLDQNYVDIVQILGRLARQKDQIYPRSCLEFVKAIIAYYHRKLQIDPDNPDAQTNNALDIHFLQTKWLPLLSAIYGICGDTRKQVQSGAIQCLFQILVKYGRIFKYQFWKMILQGVLRPTFQQIIYTSQSKSLKKNQLEAWLKYSFQFLFSSIGQLISQYYQDFRMFLYDVLKIYQNCLLNFSNKLLIQLSVEALQDLLVRVGQKFQHIQWQQFFKFLDSVIKKCLPQQLTSLQNWKLTSLNSQKNYQGKCNCLYLIMTTLYDISQKYGINFTQYIYLQVENLAFKVYDFSHKFNKDIQLRENLMKQGFYSDMKSLPGLIKQQHIALKCLTHAKFRLRIHSEDYIRAYFSHATFIMNSYRDLLIVQSVKELSLNLEEQQRQSTMLKVLMLDIVLKEIRQIGFQTIRNLGLRQQLFETVLSISTQKLYCSKCKFCQACQLNNQRQTKFVQQIKKLLLQLFAS